MGKSLKPVIVISAINFRSGGPLSILRDCLRYLQETKVKVFRIVALVHDKTLFDEFSKIEFIEFPKSVSSYIYRFYYEYYEFEKLSRQLKPHLWLSLHDMTPKVEANIQAVYCHNPAPFYRPNLKEIRLDPKFAVFSFLYKFIYRIYIKRNNFVIVQQEVIRQSFKQAFNLKQVVVAHPNIEEVKKTIAARPQVHSDHEKKFQFFFPTLPRFFKNIEVIIDAVKLLNHDSESLQFNVAITISEEENTYAKHIYKHSQGIKNLDFVGRLTRSQVFEFYENADCLIFPSKLETWGLPISEFKQTNKPILLADVPYAYETVGNYEHVSFFEPNNPYQLASLMRDIILGNYKPQGNKAFTISQPYCNTWADLFSLLLDEESFNSLSTVLDKAKNEFY